MMRFHKVLCVLALAAVTGCTGLKNAPDGGPVPMQSYNAKFCSTTDTPVPDGDSTLCYSVGPFDMPQALRGVVLTGMLIGNKHLHHSKKVGKDCKFTADPKLTANGLGVSAAITCMVDGLPVSEELSVTLTPAA